MLASAAAPSRARRARRGIVLDALVVAGLVALMAFPVLARHAADRLPVAPAPAVTLPPDASTRDGRITLLPAGMRGPAGGVRAAAEALLGERRARALLGQVSKPTWASAPYTFPELERIVPVGADPAGATDLGARLMLVGSTGANMAAYVLFERADGCAARVNLELMLVAEDGGDPAAAAAAKARATLACPGDPTPGWISALHRSITEPAAGLRELAALRKAFPRSSDVWAAEADAYLRVAYAQSQARAFVVRRLFERALAGYRRAAALGARRTDVDLGMARALAGVERPGEAADLQRRGLAGRPVWAPLDGWLVEYLETAHRFPEASRAAARAAGLPWARRPAGPGMFPAAGDEGNDALESAEAGAPLSVGAGTLRGVRFSLGGRSGNNGAIFPVGDLSFLPVYRPSAGVTGSDRACPEWARRRDELLAGRPAVARADLPQVFTGRDGTECGNPEPEVLAGIAALELGESSHAGVPYEQLQDERQNLWRWAGDYAHAERAAREWAAARPSAWSRIRLGEIEFLRRRYDGAARYFDLAARLAREDGDEVQVAEARVKQGAALHAAGRRDEALTALRTADDIATQAKDEETLDAAHAWSYYALAQLGDALREAGKLPAAADAYAAARRLEPRLMGMSTDFQVAHLWTNSAIAELGLGHPERALRLARKPIAVDPANPLFLTTAGYAAVLAGHADVAIGLYRRALVSYHAMYPAANDLGVLLARRDRDDEAVAVLRRAVGANRRYALGWFNLGVVLSGMGPRHLPASQGALARAFALDKAFRDRERRTTLDAREYRTGLDVSRPLPPEWNFAATQRDAPVRTAGLAAFLLIALTLARGLASTGSGRALAEQWLGPLGDMSARVRLPAWSKWPGVAIAATLAVLLWPLVRDPGGGLTATLAGALALVLLVGVAQRARAAILRQDAANPHTDREDEAATTGREPTFVPPAADTDREAAHAGSTRGDTGPDSPAPSPGRDRAPSQETWPLGVGFGIGAALTGFTWAPLPVVRGGSLRAHWAAAFALVCVGVPLVLLAAWLEVPLARAVAASALIMAASLLTPVKPVDGGAIAAAGNAAAGLAAAGLAALVVLGLA